MEQRHLGHKDTINLGSYYTPTWPVDIVYSLLDKNVLNFSDYHIIDTSCGYGGFLRGQNAIGSDIDSVAIEAARAASAQVKYFNHNSLLGISRTQYGLGENAKIIIVGNPPYNDTTSMIRNDIKESGFLRDAEVMSRDLGISFLLSYNKLEADYVCVLHPLSYIIKKANFRALGRFKNNYKLIDSVVISSGVFSATSKTTYFPIVIALYERNPLGMEYNYIQNYKFNTNDDKVFSINEHDPIGNYISKYPNKKTVSEEDTIAYFYTMRDINALKRTATFLKEETGNAIRITKQKLPYYCYVDVFKDYIPHIPYYFGNSDVFINDEGFSELRSVFMNRSVQKHPKLEAFVEHKNYNDTEKEITGYFRQLLGAHYVN